MLSSEKISQFLENTLRFKNWKTELNLNKLGFLRKFLRHFVTNIYFQNITMTSIAPEDRHGPSNISEIIDNGLSGQGGVCIDLNYFAYLILISLGFDCTAVQGTYTASPITGNHCAVIVKLSENEKYLVDVASILPGLEVIPMHKLPFSFIGGGLNHEWRYCDDGIYRRYQIGGKLFKIVDNDKLNNSEEVRVELSPQSKTLEDYNDPMKDVFTNVEISFLLRAPFLFRYLDDADDESAKFVYIWGTKVLIGTKESRHLTTYADLKEITAVIEEYFPKIDKVELQNSMKHFEKILKSVQPAF